MRQRVEAVRRLWRGEHVRRHDGDGREIEVRIHPRPVQRELPIWVTAAGSPETFRLAGEIGANLLTNLLGQSFEQLAGKIAIFRSAWREHRHGPGTGCVTLMLHTFVGSSLDVVREKVQKPFLNYLRSSADLWLRSLLQSLGQDIDAEALTEDDLEFLLSHAFNRYFETSGLFGTPSACLRMIARLQSIGVDEVACLIDFGVDFDSVISSLQYLDTVRERSNTICQN